MSTLTFTERLAAKRSQAARPSVNRTSIEVYEDYDGGLPHLGVTIVTRRFWVARLDGPLSTGEEVALERQAPTAAEAIIALEAAIDEQGWTIREPKR